MCGVICGGVCGGFDYIIQQRGQALVLFRLTLIQERRGGCGCGWANSASKFGI